MTKKTKALQDICDLAVAQVQEIYPNLQLMFLFHESGQFHEVVAVREHELLEHPAGRIAQTILDKNNHREHSSFLGLAIHHEVRWLGLASSDSILALFNINLDEAHNAKQARKTIYHMIWHAIDLLEVRQRPEYISKFRSGPMIPKRSPMNLAHLNLQADIFAAVMSGLLGEEDAIDSLAHARASDSIAPIHAKRAEDYPFVIALDTARYAYRELIALNPPKTKFLTYARQLALEVGKTFDDKSILQWWGFSEPAQEMAWRHFPSDMILGCAVFTSDDPFVRATGNLVAELSGIEPLPMAKIGETYNAFADIRKSQILHRQLVEKTFEEAVAKGLLEESGAPLVTVANEQNEKLTEGVILGWCANALQAAARAFDNARSSGASPDQAARMEFAGTRDDASWDTLQKVGTSIIDKKRKGFAVTLGTVAEICGNHPGLATVMNSIKATMKDPGYLKKIEAANDFAPRGPAIAPSAAPSIAPMPAIPAYAASIPAPGLGSGGGNARQIMADRMRQQEQQHKDAGDTERTQ